MRKLLVLGILLAACGKKGSNDPPPAQPSTGAPVAFVAKSFKPGTDHGGSVDVKAYNFSDKRVAQYWLLFRYYDATGAVLMAKAGTPFEKNYDFMSMSGRKYACAPKSWCSFTVDGLDVPAKTAKVDVLAKSVTALKDDTNFEDKPMFDLPGMGWPGEAEGAAPKQDEAPPIQGSAGPGPVDVGSAAAGSAAGSAQ